MKFSEEAAESELKQVKDQLGDACVEISRLKNNLSVLALEEEAFKGNDKKVSFYTGIPSWDLFSKLFMYLKPHLSSEKALTPFQHHSRSSL